MSRVPSIAITSTAAMVRAARALEVDVEPIVRGEGVRPEALLDPDARLPLPAALRIWARLSEACGDPHLALTAPSLLPAGAYGVLDFLAAATPTLGQWIEIFARHYRIVTNAVDMRVQWFDDRPCLDVRLASGGAVVPEFVDYTFAAVVLRSRLRAYPDWVPALVEFRHEAPDDVGPYESLFRGPVVFNAEADRLWCGAEDWLAESAEADPPLSLLLEDHARILSEAIPPYGDFVQSVRKAIAEVLQAGATAEDVAAKLSISTRTLQRRLTNRDTTYKAVLDDVREGLARGYLARSELAIGEVAFILGFSEQSSFNRAFKRWTGAPPGDWRRRALLSSEDRASGPRSPGPQGHA